jgi:hemerythrin
MQWKDEFKIGIPVIDAQHKQLFLYNKEFNDALTNGLRKATIDTILTQLGLYIARHFAMEEQYMEETSYPDLPLQLETHRHFTKRLAEIQTEFKHKGLNPTIAHTIQNELNLWIKDHILGLDQAFGSYYKKQEKKVQP